MKILGDKIIREPGLSLMSVGESVIKIPWRSAARKEMTEEKSILKEVSQDAFFAAHILPSRYIWFVQVLPRLTPATEYPEIDLLIRKYFKLAFENSSVWTTNKIINLFDAAYFTRFITEFSQENADFWNKYLSDTSLPQSSTHGDFHLGNILIKNNQLFFVDWIRYRKISSRYFDLVDFYIFQERNENEGWMDVWNKVSQNTSEIMDIKINPAILHSYAIWKTAAEIKTLYQRNALTKYKIKKYLGFLDQVKNYIQTYESKTA